MANTTGTNDISVLLATRFQSVATYGMVPIAQILAADIAAHNQVVNELVTEMAEVSADRQRIYGTSVGGQMTEVDEFGRVATQVNKPGSTVAFPLRLFQYGLGWTRKYLENATPADLAIRVQGAEKAHLKAVQSEFKKALLLGTNYTYLDHLVDKVSLSVKRLVNADSADIPEGPNGEAFDSTTHTHYLARAGGALAATDLTGLIDHVVEHGHGSQVKLAISRTNEAAVRALTGFVGYTDPRITPASSYDSAGVRLDITRLDNRALGIFSAAEVWVKPWIMANYAFCWDAGDPRKPLVFRERGGGAITGLRIAAELDTYPLHAQYMEAEYGMGVWTRTNGAALYFGDTTWADPSL